MKTETKKINNLKIPIKIVQQNKKIHLQNRQTTVQHLQKESTTQGTTETTTTKVTTETKEQKQQKEEKKKKSRKKQRKNTQQGLRSDGCSRDFCFTCSIYAKRECKKHVMLK